LQRGSTGEVDSAISEIKGVLSQKTARLVVFRLGMATARTWRDLSKVIAGVKFTDGVPVTAMANQRAA